MSILGHHQAPVAAEQLAAALARMKQAHLAEGPASLALRRDRLDRAIALLLDNREVLVAAVSADFGNRSREQTLLSDIAGSVASLKHCREHLAEWMQSESHPAPFPGCQARVEYQPLGVVGVISPWNFPIVLAFGPLASIFAAGNRAMLKPSELTPRTSALLAELLAALGSDPAHLAPGVWPARVSTGGAFVIVPLVEEAQVHALRPDQAALARISERLDLIGFYVFSGQARQPGRAAGARMFAPRYGIAEESATGMAAGPLACFLHDRLQLPGARLLIEQGYLMQPPSPSVITVDLQLAAGRIERLLAGGRAQITHELSLEL